jgi:selenocysteine lyase/cysteine desulfurase
MLMHMGLDVAALRRREFSRLDATGSVYLDYAGAALYPESLVRRDASRLRRRVLGNPHSESAPSLASTESLEEARSLTLGFFNAPPGEYEVVFTPNASGAMRILAEAFPFREGSSLVLTADNHNSVNGLRVSAEQRRAVVAYVPLDMDLRGLDPQPWLPRATQPSLFAYPAQSNFSGVRHPLRWVAEAQALGYHVLLDAAAYVPSSPLSLTDVPADFVAISFYKMFGYPTGVGALVARRDALTMLQRAYFGGGTVQFVSVRNDDLFRPRDGGAAFEDGTPNFLAMPAVCDGLRWLSRVGMSSIQQHVGRITSELLNRFAGLGDRVRVYGPSDAHDRGGVVTFNLFAHDRTVDYEVVEAAARGRDIAIRGGCFCNPGAAEHAFGFNAAAARACLEGEFSVARFRSCVGSHAVGALRASLGVATTDHDLERVVELVSELTASQVNHAFRVSRVAETRRRGD